MLKESESGNLANACVEESGMRGIQWKLGARGEFKDGQIIFELDFDVKELGGFVRAIGWALWEPGQSIIILGAEDPVNALHVLGHPCHSCFTFFGCPSGRVESVGYHSHGWVKLHWVVEDREYNFNRSEFGGTPPNSSKDFGAQVGKRRSVRDAPQRGVGHLRDGDGCMHAFPPVAGGGQRVHPTRCVDRSIKLGVGMGLRVFEVDVDGLTDEDFGLVDSWLVAP